MPDTGYWNGYKQAINDDIYKTLCNQPAARGEEPEAYFKLNDKTKFFYIDLFYSAKLN